MRILIAEDQALQRRILEAGLRKAGYGPDSYADGQAAWERFLEAPSRMVITDWTMPRLAGVDLIRRIREQDLDRHTYVILLTARDKKDDVVAGLSSGADDYLTKPFDPRELDARVAIGQRMISLEDRLLTSQERLERLATYDGLDRPAEPAPFAGAGQERSPSLCTERQPPGGGDGGCGPLQERQ